MKLKNKVSWAICLIVSFTLLFSNLLSTKNQDNKLSINDISVTKVSAATTSFDNNDIVYMVLTDRFSV